MIESILRLKVLFIDEISMMSAKLMDTVDYILRGIRATDRQNGHVFKKLPFGGLQVIFVGDFCQLPPVSEHGKPKERMAFHSKAWSDAKITTVEFTEIKRQEGDDAFKSVLNEIRFGFVSDEAHTMLRKRVKAKLQIAPGIVPTKLYAKRVNVASENNRELDRLSGANTVFVAKDTGNSKTLAKYIEQADKNGRCAKELRLKIGAQVILRRNLKLSEGLANGSRGVVVDFVLPTSDTVARDEEGEEETKEKDKDKDKDKDKTKKEDETKGQQDAALSDDALLSLMQEIEDDRTQDSHVMFDSLVKAKKDGPDSTEKLPLVRFVNGITKVIPRVDSKIVKGKQVVFNRRQVPLSLGWAGTIHMSQGMTLDAASVSCKGMFEEGQFYVALSRVRALKYLTLEDYDRSLVKANSDAVVFYRKLAGGKLPTDAKQQAEKDKLFAAAREMAIDRKDTKQQQPSQQGLKRKFEESKKEEEKKATVMTAMTDEANEEEEEEEEEDEDEEEGTANVLVDGMWVSVAVSKKKGAKRQKV